MQLPPSSKNPKKRIELSLVSRKENPVTQKSKRSGPTASQFMQFLDDAANSFARANEARELMHRPESHFARLGTTRESAIRRLFEI